ncbi:MAG TPA: response regulator [Candidatus Angelobacter sp.]|nr:response regulator [Candidatus Angelobacter sp.]
MARILLIDDEDDLREFVAIALHYHGHEVTEAKSGRVITDPAKGAAAASAYDLIITDIVMPDSDGLETIIAARKAHPTGKIIAMSGGNRGAPGTGADYLQQAHLLGADATLGKPFSTADLFRTVEQTLHAA